MRLNQHLRKCIVDELIQRRFGERAKKLKKNRAAFGMSIYRTMWTSVERKKMAGLPNGWLASTNNIRAALTSRGHRHLVDYFDVGESVRIPHSQDHNVLMVVDKENPKLVERWEGLIEEAEALRSEQAAARTEASKIVGSFQTTKRLKEHWPKISDVIDKFAPDKATTALVAPVKKANELLGLV